MTVARMLIGSVLALAGCGQLGAGGSYSLGYRASHGADMVQSGVAGGTVTSIRYREQGGPIGKILLLIATAPRMPTGQQTVDVRSSTSCGTTVCETTTTTTTTTAPVTAEQIEQYKREVAEWTVETQPKILSGEQSVEVMIDVASTSLGGDTDGGMIGMMFTAPAGTAGPFRTSVLSFGLAGGSYTMRNRMRSTLTDNGSGSLVLSKAPAVVSYDYVGLPVRFTGSFLRRAAVYFQLDLNLISLANKLTDDAQVSQIGRVGLITVLPGLQASVELSADRLRTDSLAGTFEVGFAF